jgi:dTDP-L-rhamnose 4-epimerase
MRESEARANPENRRGSGGFFEKCVSQPGGLGSHGSAMRILITGGAGFIGSHIADRFLREGWAVRVMDSLQPRVHPDGLPKYVLKDIEFIKGDVTWKNDWEKALKGVDVVSHQAAYQDYVPDYSQFMATNVVGTALLFEVIAAQKLPVQRVVMASSQAVYGEGQYSCPQHSRILAHPRRLQDLERRLWEVACPQCGMPTTPLLLEEPYPNPLSPYGTSKYSQEITGLKLARMLNIPCVALRYSITQGPRQSLFNQYSGIARIFTVRLLASEPPIAFEDGLLQRDYIHVSDVVEANWLVTHDNRAVGRAFNVGSGKPTTVLEYAHELANRLGKKIEPEIPGVYRLGDARHSVSSIESLKALGWKPKRDLQNILDDFLAWVDTLGNVGRYLSDAHQKLIEMEVLRTTHAG